MQINAHKDKVPLPKMDSNEIIVDDILSDQLKLIISNPNKIAEINSNIFNTEKDTLDSYAFAVFTLYSEAKRRNWSKRIEVKNVFPKDTPSHPHLTYYLALP